MVIFIVVATAAACSGNNNGNSASQPHVPQAETEPGGPLARVPDLRGDTLEALALEFENLGFTPSLLMFISDEPKNTILSIKRMGQLVPVPSCIEVHVSAGLPDWDPEAPPEEPSSSGPTAQQKQYESMEFGGIEWLVLEKKEDRVLLLSRFVLFDRKYNDELASTTWEISSIRSYLNNEFFNSFAPEERERIAETKVINDDRMYQFAFGELWIRIQDWPVPAGNDTYDRVFLLSYDEQRGFFANDSDRRARMTDDHPKHDSGYDHWWWWLRSPGGCTFTAAVVSTEGQDIAGYEVIREIGVRPALWLYLDR